MTYKTKRPTPRFKPAAHVAATITKRARRLGIIGLRELPSRSPAARRRQRARYHEAHPHARAEFNAKRRQVRADTKALRDAPIGSPTWLGAVLRHKDCPKDQAGQVRFAHELALARVAPQYDFIAE